MMKSKKFKSERKGLLIFIDKYFHSVLKVECLKRGISMNMFINDLIIKELDKNEKEY